MTFINNINLNIYRQVTEKTTQYKMVSVKKEYNILVKHMNVEYNLYNDFKFLCLVLINIRLIDTNVSGICIKQKTTIV